MYQLYYICLVLGTLIIFYKNTHRAEAELLRGLLGEIVSRDHIAFRRDGSAGSLSL